MRKLTCEVRNSEEDAWRFRTEQTELFEKKIL